MNLIASCPACHTSYQLVRDQLRISDGWVRCGQCGEVFDASQPLTSVRAADRPTPTVAPENDFVQTLQGVTDRAAGSDQNMAAPGPDVAKQHASSATELPWATATLLIKPSSDTDSEPHGHAAPDWKPLAEPVSFMRDEVAGQPGRSTHGWSVTWWCLGAVLLMMLVGQALYREREWMAARFPELEPVLQSACERTGCRLSLLQRVEYLEIDSASFQRVGPELFELRFVVKNKASYVLARPALELTLTDLSEQAVVRRVLTPAELGAKPESMAAAGEWAATAYLSIRTDAGVGRAQGYRLLIFYP